MLEYTLPKGLVRKPVRLKAKVNIPGFEDSDFTDISERDLIMPDAVNFASGLDAILQNLPEAIISGFEVNPYERDIRFALRNTAIYWQNKGKLLLAINDSPNFEENIGLGRVREGAHQHVTKNRWQYRLDNPIIQHSVNRAREQGRILEISGRKIELSTDEPSYFDGNRTSSALMGNLAIVCADLLREREYSKVVIYEAKPEQLTKQGVDSEHVEIRSIGLHLDKKMGKGNYICEIIMGYPFNFKGYARGVYNPPKFKK